MFRYDFKSKDVKFSVRGTWTVKIQWAEADTFAPGGHKYNSGFEVVTNTLFTKAWKIAHADARRKELGWTPILFTREVYYNGKLVARYS